MVDYLLNIISLMFFCFSKQLISGFLQLEGYFYMLKKPYNLALLRTKRAKTLLQQNFSVFKKEK